MKSHGWDSTRVVSEPADIPDISTEAIVVLTTALLEHPTFRVNHDVNRLEAVELLEIMASMGFTIAPRKAPSE